jgi:O-succinylbenzoate synthase
MDGDVTGRPLMPADGELPVRRVEVDQDLLERYAAPAERQQWWTERLERTYRVLAGMEAAG